MSCTFKIAKTNKHYYYIYTAEKLKDKKKPQQEPIKIKMTRDKYLCYYYCSTLKRGQIVEHLKVGHHKEVDVAATMAMGPVVLSKAFELIRNKGNFEHNVKVLQGDAPRESFIPIRRQEKYVNPPDYIPCPSCYGFFYHPELWRHVKHHCKQVNREDGSET